MVGAVFRFYIDNMGGGGFRSSCSMDTIIDLTKKIDSKRYFIANNC